MLFICLHTVTQPNYTMSHKRSQFDPQKDPGNLCFRPTDSTTRRQLLLHVNFLKAIEKKRNFSIKIRDSEIRRFKYQYLNTQRKLQSITEQNSDLVERNAILVGQNAVLHRSLESQDHAFSALQDSHNHLEKQLSSHVSFAFVFSGFSFFYYFVCVCVNCL